MKKEINIFLFLKILIKNQPYVAFTYMTGILPIAKNLEYKRYNRYQYQCIVHFYTVY